MTYTTIVADPPWAYNDKLRMSKGSAAEDHYDVMTPQAICDLATGSFKGMLDTYDRRKVKDLRIAKHSVADDAILFMWTTNPMLLDGTAAQVVTAWGFTPKQLITWVKGEIEDVITVDIGWGVEPLQKPMLIPRMGLGHYTRGATEHMVLATRGRAKPLVKQRNIPNVFVAPVTKHSEKPQEAFDLIERLVPGPYLELFARKPREGWTVWGNEV